MATNAATGAARQLKSASGKFAVWKKYTVQSTGVWERFRRAFAVDPERSTGVPLNAQYRNPPPGANPPELFDDPVTIPSGDIAENPYYKRDVRRSYPKLSVLKQADVVGLLTVGSQSAPKENALEQGDAGSRQLAEIKQKGQEGGVAAYLKTNKPFGILDSEGLPPNPSGQFQRTRDGRRLYDLDQASGYPESYPCRTFT